MLIDWFTVFAQTVNFLILIALLKRFLYRPLLGLLARREAEIRARLDESAAARRIAEAEAARLADERRALAAHREDLLAAARAEGEAFLEQELATARARVAAQREEWQAAFAQERERFGRRVRLGLGGAFFRLARKALGDLAGQDLEAHLMASFLAREDAVAAPGPVTVRSGFAIEEPARQQLHAMAGARPVRFLTAPELGFGIEIVADGHKIAWNLDRYLHDLEAEAEALLAGPGKGAPHA